MKENGGAIAAAKKKVKKEDSAILLKKSQNKGKSTDEANSVDNLTIEDDDGRKVSILPKWIKFMPSGDEFYPAEFDKVIYDCYSL
jgi:hypothetical protein